MHCTFEMWVNYASGGGLNYVICEQSSLSVVLLTKFGKISTQTTVFHLAFLVTFIRHQSAKVYIG